MDSPKRYHPVLVTLHWLMAILVLFNLYFGLFVVMDLRNIAQLDSNLAIHMTVGIIILLLLLIRFIVRLRTKKPETAWTGNALMDRFSKLVHYGLYFFLLVMTVAGLLYSIQSFSFQSVFLGEARPAFGGPGGPGGGGPGFNRGGGTPVAPGVTGTPGTPAPRLNAQGTPFAPGLQVNGGGGDDNGGQEGEGRRFGGGFGPGGPGGGGRFGGGPSWLGFLRGFRGPGLLIIHATTAVILILLLLFHIGAALYHQFIRKDNLLARMWYGK